MDIVTEERRPINAFKAPPPEYESRLCGSSGQVADGGCGLAVSDVGGSRLRNDGVAPAGLVGQDVGR